MQCSAKFLTRGAQNGITLQEDINLCRIFAMSRPVITLFVTFCK